MELQHGLGGKTALFHPLAMSRDTFFWMRLLKSHPTWPWTLPLLVLFQFHLKDHWVTNMLSWRVLSWDNTGKGIFSLFVPLISDFFDHVYYFKEGRNRRYQRTQVLQVETESHCS